MDTDSALHAWTVLIGQSQVLPAEAAQRRFGGDTTGDRRCIAGALRPDSADQVADIVRIAAEHGVPLYPISTGRNWGYGSGQPASDGCVVLDLSGLVGIRIDPELGTATVEPGVTQGMLADLLVRERLPFLVPVSGAGPDASLLGNALERGYGITPSADHFAAVTSLEAVLPDGSRYRSALAELGGTTVASGFKWGIGPYLDGIFTQSSLGIVTCATIALARRPERVEAFVFQIGDDGLAGAVEGVREILRRLPGIVGGINLMNRHRVLAMSIPHPGCAPGTVLPEALVRREADRLGIAAWSGFGTLYGTRRTVAAAHAEIRACLRGRARRLIFTTPSGCERLAKVAAALPGWLTGGYARQLAVLAEGLRLVDGRPGEIAMPLCYWRGGTPPVGGHGHDPARDGCGLRWYAPLVPMLPAEVVRFVQRTAATAAAHGMEPLITLTSLSERCFDSTVPLLFDRADPASVARATACHAQLRDEGCAAGWVPYRVGIGEQRWLCDRDDPCWRLVQTIKHAVDPQGIIAPGRYAPLAPSIPLAAAG
jgi:4-cresol dehydrogenase (hydroxylating)